jgi:cell division protein DivIC
VADNKRTDPKRRGPTSRPGSAAGRRPRAQPGTGPRESGRRTLRAQAESLGQGITEPIRRAISASAAERSEQQLGLTARRAAILAALVCVLTLTLAGPVRTYFAQRTEMRQLAASEAALRAQIADLEGEKAKLADPVYIAAQARERLGFVMPGDIPYEVQLPPGAVIPESGPQSQNVRSDDPWYSALWHTIADVPHGPPITQTPPAPAPPPAPPPGPTPPPVPGG